ncbi:MAG: hypothetical protein HRU35_07545 [Rickettsiaceae bacterium]|nr:hypothetical protein [Rickettsiaceae bacterium]
MSIKIGNQTIQFKAGGKLIVPPGSKVILPPNYVIAPTRNVQKQKSDSRNHKPQPAKSQDNKAKLLGNKVKKQFNLNKHTSAAEPNKNKKNPTASPINKKLINSQKGVNQK